MSRQQQDRHLQDTIKVLIQWEKISIIDKVSPLGEMNFEDQICIGAAQLCVAL